MEETNNFFKSLNLIHIAMLVGLVVFFGFAYLLIETGDFPSDIAPETQYMLSTSGILIAIAAIPLAFYIFSLRAKRARQTANPAEKLEIYKSAVILKLALIELAGFTNSILFLVSGDQQSMYLGIMTLLVMLVARPSENQFNEDFKSSEF